MPVHHCHHCRVGDVAFVGFCVSFRLLCDVFDRSDMRTDMIPESIPRGICWRGSEINRRKQDAFSHELKQAIYRLHQNPAFRIRGDPS